MKWGLKYDKDILVGKSSEDTEAKMPGSENYGQKSLQSKY